MQLIVHHWDTDGITSTALLVRALKLEEFTNMAAPIGEFRFDDRIWRAIERAERLYVLDFNVPDEAEKVKVPTLFIDHHSQPKIENPLVEQVNPSLEGNHYPSCSLVVSERFNLFNPWTALGAIGDLGERAFELEWVGKLIEKEGLSKEEALKLVELIDSNYIVMDREGVEEAVKVLLNNPLRKLLDYEPWVRKVEVINESIEEALSGVEEREGFAFVRFKSPHNIISKVARKLVWERGYPGAVVINENFHGRAQLYFRLSSEEAERFNLPEIIELVKKTGVNAGGKREVLGCVCERGKVEEVLRLIESQLGW